MFASNLSCCWKGGFLQDLPKFGKPHCHVGTLVGDQSGNCPSLFRNSQPALRRHVRSGLCGADGWRHDLLQLHDSWFRRSCGCSRRSATLQACSWKPRAGDELPSRWLGQTRTVGSDMGLELTHMVETFSRGEMFCLYLSGTFCSQFSQKEELTLEGMLVHLCLVSWWLG